MLTPINPPRHPLPPPHDACPPGMRHIPSVARRGHTYRRYKKKIQHTSKKCPKRKVYSCKFKETHSNTFKHIQELIKVKCKNTHAIQFGKSCTANRDWLTPRSVLILTHVEPAARSPEYQRGHVQAVLSHDAQHDLFPFTSCTLTASYNTTLDADSNLMFALSVVAYGLFFWKMLLIVSECSEAVVVKKKNMGPILTLAIKGWKNLP